MNEAEVNRLRAENADLRARLDVMQASKFWKLRNAWFSLKERLRSLRRRPATSVKIRNAFPKRVSASKIFEIRNAVASMKWLPTISILVTLDDSMAVKALSGLVSLLNAQAYMYWELCVAYDVALNDEVEAIAPLYELPAERLRVLPREKWHDPARGANSALALATGEFVLLLRRGKTLVDDALYEVASVLNEHSEADVVIGPRAEGRAFRRSLVLEVNGFTPEAGTQIEAKLAETLKLRGVSIYTTSVALVADQPRIKAASVA